MSDDAAACFLSSVEIMIDPLDLDHLRVFFAITGHGSSSATGRTLRRAQSAVSNAVANLEETSGGVFPVAALKYSLASRRGSSSVILAEHTQIALTERSMPTLGRTFSVFGT